eukprot:scaffold124832_cov36-Prasinocladus_malaysianus.AAC.1
MQCHGIEPTCSEYVASAFLPSGARNQDWLCSGALLLIENFGLRVQGVNPNVLRVCTEVPLEMDADFITEQLAQMEVRPAHCLRSLAAPSLCLR